jgi:hypothetical protein
MEDLFLGGQWSIILGYRRLSVKSLFSLSYGTPTAQIYLSFNNISFQHLQLQPDISFINITPTPGRYQRVSLS